MAYSRLLSVLIGTSLAATATLTAVSPSLQAEENAVSDPQPSQNCSYTLQTSASVQANAGGQNRQSLDGIMAVGVQNFSKNFRPWIEVAGEDGRWRTNTTVEFSITGQDGYTFTAHTKESPHGIPTARFTNLVTESFAPTPTVGRGFTADLGAFNPTGEKPAVGQKSDAWGGAMWYASNPNGVPSDTGTIVAKTTVLPYPNENDECQPLGVDTTQPAGAVVTGGSAADYKRITSAVYLQGSDKPIEGATVTVDADGAVSVELPDSIQDVTSVEVQLTAIPREDSATYPTYRTPVNIGERFTVTTDTQVEPGPTSSDGRCLATASAVALPLIFLAPLALATQVNIPGLTPLVEQAQASLAAANTELQKNLGIFNPELARLVHEANAGQLLGAAGTIALALAGTGIIVNACAGGSSLSSGSSE